MKPTQVKDRLKVRLLSGQSVTPLQALRRWGCFRLAVYVNRLRNEGMKIKTEMVSAKGSTFAKYSLR